MAPKLVPDQEVSQYPNPGMGPDGIGVLGMSDLLSTRSGVSLSLRACTEGRLMQGGVATTELCPVRKKKPLFFM